MECKNSLEITVSICQMTVGSTATFKLADSVSYPEEAAIRTLFPNCTIATDWSLSTMTVTKNRELTKEELPKIG